MDTTSHRYSGTTLLMKMERWLTIILTPLTRIIKCPLYKKRNNIISDIEGFDKINANWDQ